jgi:hypothetical protein
MLLLSDKLSKKPFPLRIVVTVSLSKPIKDGATSFLSNLVHASVGDMDDRFGCLEQYGCITQDQVINRSRPMPQYGDSR